MRRERGILQGNGAAFACDPGWSGASVTAADNPWLCLSRQRKTEMLYALAAQRYGSSASRELHPGAQIQLFRQSDGSLMGASTPVVSCWSSEGPRCIARVRR